jgi:hypothetical protein
MRVFILIFIAVFSAFVPAQTQKIDGFKILEGASKVDIPFDYINNFIIVELYLNGVYPYKLIFDTGAEHTILTRKDFMSAPGMTFERTFYLIGSDQTSIIPAHLVRGIRMDIPNRISSRRQDILMLDEDLFLFKEFTGVEIDGILSATVFDDFVFRINYQRKVITLFEHTAYDRPSKRKSDQIELEMSRGKPYLFTSAVIRSEQPSIPLKLLVDSGASSSLILFTDTDARISPPPGAITGNIGMGLGGNLAGFIGRINRIEIGKYSQNQVISHYQEIDSIDFKDFLNCRDGLLGNGIMSRFIVDFDYRNKLLTLQPTSKYQRPYQFDRSGLNIVSTGKRLQYFTVFYTLPNSPATDADIRTGDRILSVQRIPVQFLNINTLLSMLRRSGDRTVRITIKRDGKKLVKKMKLRNLLD